MVMMLRLFQVGMIMCRNMQIKLDFGTTYGKKMVENAKESLLT